jgi:signal transduction histidine kinase
MPAAAWDEEWPRFRPPPGVTLWVPVAIALLLQVPATIAVAAWQDVAPRDAALSIALAAASALSLIGARRWPGPTVAVVTALTALDLFIPPDAGPVFVALAFAIIGAVVRGARVWALVSVGVGWLVAVTANGLTGIPWHPFRVALATLFLGLFFAIGAGIRARLRHGEERRAQIAERRRTVEQDERTRMARELHDVLAHSLSQISVQSGMGLHLFDREPERAREALANIRGLSATGLDEVRGVLAFLRGDEQGTPQTAPLTPQPQLADLPRLVAERTGLGLVVRLDDRVADAPPSGSLQTTAYRIVQEALTNVVRHSAASTATVTLERVGDALVIRIVDDGTAASADVAEGGGIRGMRERAALVDGSLRIQPGERSGTVVTAELPWDDRS